MAADPRHRLGANVCKRRQQRHRGDEVVGAQPHLHGTGRIRCGRDGAAEGQDLDARKGHDNSLSERKKRSASGARIASAGARYPSDT